MKITANRLDDLRKAREEYDAETKRLNDQSEANAERWRSDTYDKQEQLEKSISDMIGATTLNLEIRVDPWGRSFGDHNTWGINVRANENDKFNDNVALAWNWEAYLDNDGNIKKDSGSWSGLKAVTPEQIADLEESVRIIKMLNNMDWETILRSPKPSYEDYVDRDLNQKLRDRKTNRPDFDKDIQAEELVSYVGTNTAVQLSSDEYYNGKVGILLTGMTDKFLKGYIFPWSLTQEKYQGDKIRTVDDVKNYVYNEERRTSKSKIVYNGGELVTYTFS